MSLKHFVRHLPCGYRSCVSSFPVHRLFPPAIPPPSPLMSGLSSYLLEGGREKRRWHSDSQHRRFYPAAADSSTYASDESTMSSATDPFSDPYLSVRIHCALDVAICINLIFPEGEDIGACISHAADSIGLQSVPSHNVIAGEQCDWIKNTQVSFLPVKVTERLWIVPEWTCPPDAHATNIILNPGLAFGTGDHPTTKLCLLLLHHLIKGGEYFLDYGTGSGILAIAALKLGGARSVGFDIDPEAIRSARYNAALNNIEPEKMQLYLNKTSSHFTDGMTVEDNEMISSNCMRVNTGTEKYDVVFANILLNPLLDLADDIVSYAKPGAVVGVSGLLSDQLPLIMERYSKLLEGLLVSEMDGWACVCGTKKGIGSAGNEELLTS